MLLSNSQAGCDVCIMFNLCPKCPKAGAIKRYHTVLRIIAGHPQNNVLWNQHTVSTISQDSENVLEGISASCVMRALLGIFASCVTAAWIDSVPA